MNAGMTLDRRVVSKVTDRFLAICTEPVISGDRSHPCVIRDVPRSLYVEGGIDFLLISKEQRLLRLRHPRSIIQIEDARLPSNGEIDGKPKKALVYFPVTFVAVEGGSTRNGERRHVAVEDGSAKRGERRHVPGGPEGPNWPKRPETTCPVQTPGLSECAGTLAMKGKVLPIDGQLVSTYV